MKCSLHQKFAVLTFGHFDGTEYSLFIMVYTFIHVDFFDSRALNFREFTKVANFAKFKCKRKFPVLQYIPQP